MCVCLLFAHSIIQKERFERIALLARFGCALLSLSFSRFQSLCIHTRFGCFEWFSNKLWARLNLLVDSIIIYNVLADGAGAVAYRGSRHVSNPYAHFCSTQNYIRYRDTAKRKMRQASNRNDLHAFQSGEKTEQRAIVRSPQFFFCSFALSLTTNIIHIVRNIKNDISKMRHSLIYVMWLVVFSLLKMQRVKKIKLWKENARTTLSHTVKTCVCFLRIVCLLFKFWICNYYGWMRTVYAHCNSLYKYVISTFYVILCKYQAHDLSIIHPATLRFARLFMYYLHFRAAATTSFSINQRKQHYFVKNIA